MGTKYVYDAEAKYLSESTPITISKIPIGDHTVYAKNGQREGKMDFTSSAGTIQEELVIDYPQVYGFRIEDEIADPSSRVTYPQEIFGCKNLAYGKTPASGTGSSCMKGWAQCPLISGIHRQIGNSGDGWTDIPNNAPWTKGSGNNDVMVYIPTWYMKIVSDESGLECAFSEKKLDDTWKDYAGSVGDTRIGHFRIGCFAGDYSNETGSGLLYSRGNNFPGAGYAITISNYEYYAKARGEGYDITTWFHWWYLISLATLLYKSTDLRSSLARGINIGNSTDNRVSETSISYSNEYGMYGSSTSNTQQMSFFWIQNLWGNSYYYLGNVALTGNRANDATVNRSLMLGNDYSTTSEDKMTRVFPGTTNVYNTVPKRLIGSTDIGYFTMSPSGGESGKYYVDSWAYGSSAASTNVTLYARAEGPFGICLTNYDGWYTQYIVARLTYRL